MQNVFGICVFCHWLNDFIIFIHYSLVFALFVRTANDIDISDVGSYPATLTQSLHDRIIRNGPNQISIEFPITNDRSFSSFYYTKQMSIGEEIQREWLVYSKMLDSVHCFCCRIFAPTVVGIASAKGVNDWRHLTDRIKHHKCSASHLKNLTKWKTMSVQSSSTIDNQLLQHFKNEKERLKQVFRRLISFILFFARQNIAFTGSSSSIHDINGKNGNILQLIHTVARKLPFK